MNSLLRSKRPEALHVPGVSALVGVEPGERAGELPQQGDATLIGVPAVRRPRGHSEGIVVGHDNGGAKVLSTQRHQPPVRSWPCCGRVTVRKPGAVAWRRSAWATKAEPWEADPACVRSQTEGGASSRTAKDKGTMPCMAGVLGSVSVTGSMTSWDTEATALRRTVTTAPAACRKGPRVPLAAAAGARSNGASRTAAGMRARLRGKRLVLRAPAAGRGEARPGGRPLEGSWGSSRRDQCGSYPCAREMGCVTGDGPERRPPRLPPVPRDLTRFYPQPGGATPGDSRTHLRVGGRRGPRKFITVLWLPKRMFLF